MHTHTYVHEHTCASITPSTRWDTDTETHNLCTNMHTHTHTHVYKRIQIPIHTHMHIYTYIHVRTHTHIHIYTHTHTNCTYERTQSTSERRGSNCVGSPTSRQEALPFSLSAAIRRGIPFVASSQIARHEERRISAEQPQPTAAHRTITTARRPDHIRLSALVWSRSTHFTAHPNCELGRGPPKWGLFSAIWASYLLWTTDKAFFELDGNSKSSPRRITSLLPWRLLYQKVVISDKLDYTDISQHIAALKTDLSCACSAAQFWLPQDPWILLRTFVGISSRLFSHRGGM